MTMDCPFVVACLFRPEQILVLAQIHKATADIPFNLKSWKEQPLHPKEMSEATVEWVFVADLLNFSFWSADYEVGEPLNFRISEQRNSSRVATRGVRGKYMYIFVLSYSTESLAVFIRL